MHFIFESGSDPDLLQGDLLDRTPALENALNEFHPYYRNKADYTHFLVLTQGCDLVRRPGGRCNSNYVAVSPVRSLKIVLEREASGYRNLRLLKAAGANGKKHRDKLRQFLERLFNNNHPDFFYLHEEPSIGLTNRSCAFLRLTVSLRLSDHYETILKARKASLSHQFQSKLGWLVGNIYSRIGTDDWAPKYYQSVEWKEMLEQVLDDTLKWVDDEQAKTAEKGLTDAEIAQLDPDGAFKRIVDAQIEKKKDVVIKTVMDALKGDNLLPTENVRRAENRLRNNPVLSNLLK